MRPQDIIINMPYRFKSSPNYGYAIPILILNGKEKENPHTYKIAKCWHVIFLQDSRYKTIYSRPCDLMKIKEDI